MADRPWGVAVTSCAKSGTTQEMEHMSPEPRLFGIREAKKWVGGEISFLQKVASREDIKKKRPKGGERQDRRSEAERMCRPAGTCPLFRILACSYRDGCPGENGFAEDLDKKTQED